MFNERLPEGIRSQIIRAYVRHLQTNPVLSSFIKTWDDYNGTAQDHKIIPLANCPALRFTYSAPGTSPATFTSGQANFNINLELIIPGTNQYAVIDAWEVIEAATDQFLTLDTVFRQVAKQNPRLVFGTSFLTGTALNTNKYRNPPCMIGTGTLAIVANIRR